MITQPIKVVFDSNRVQSVTLQSKWLLFSVNRTHPGTPPVMASDPPKTTEPGTLESLLAPLLLFAVEVAAVAADARTEIALKGVNCS